MILSAKIIRDFKLKDLNSRIKNIITTTIKDPDEELARMLLFQGLSKRQLKINGDIFNFLANNLPRNYASIAHILKMIEIYCHENKKNLTLIEAKKMIEDSSR